MLKQIKTTKKINKLKQNGPRNGAAAVISLASNFNNDISNNICAVCSKVEHDDIFEINNKQNKQTNAINMNENIIEKERSSFPAYRSVWVNNERR